MASSRVSADVYTDFSHFSALKAKAREHAPEALEKVARQFESVFMQMVLKSMREAGFGDSLFDSDQRDFYRDLYDKQLSIHLTRESGLGFAKLITQQLGDRTKRENSPDRGRDLDDYRAHPIQSIFRNDAFVSLDRASASAWSEIMPVPEVSNYQRFGSQDEFVEALRPHAISAARQLGVHPGILLAQAALESGWGRKPIRHPDGQDSHNLFGIKADNRWEGLTTVVSTLEYEAGIARNQRARFRSYRGFAESFQDYVRFIQDNPRYHEALRSVDDPRKYVEALQKAGYATDPDYAAKVMSIFDQNRFAELDMDQA
ncbi:MAG: flagellar assembly peptidoglycan hydrolase FlgJ [Methylococcaceae bacterium]|nr:flagellar assembly peptidoglycan hydrolase FlgJ [Methylococcaceae bacterium]